MIYLDNASTSLKRPIYVKQNMNKALEEFTNPNRGFYKSSYESGMAIFETRNLLSKFFNCEPSNIIFTQNATMALNYAVYNVCTKDDHIITTNAEHNSVLRPLSHIGCDITYINAFCSDENILKNFKEAITSKTRTFICTHASNVIGKSLPISDLALICKEHNITFILDTAQSAGLLDCDIDKLGVDILCFTGHKSLYGPTGTGGIILSKDFLAKNSFKSLLFGGNGIDTFNKNIEETLYPDSFDAGTANVVGIYGLSGGIKYINEVGREKLYNHTYNLAKNLYEEASKISGIVIYEEFKYGYTPAISLNFSRASSIDVSDILYDKFDVATRHGYHCAPLLHEHFGTKKQGMVRFSISSFNTQNDIDIALEGLQYISNRLKNNL
ncbi:MAG: aminotransferase class V-fold PLP-dependent enzyme [Lachnospirales bacterium]